MKKIHDRPDSGSTMTVQELIWHLHQYPMDAAVIAEWEGVWAGFRPENFILKTSENRVYVDVEDYG